MSEESNNSQTPQPTPARRRHFRKGLRRLGALILLAMMAFVFCLIFNNVSFSSDAQFARDLDLAIAQGDAWVLRHEKDILHAPNIALLRMLCECHELHPNPDYDRISKTFMDRPAHPACWKALVDPSWSISALQLQEQIHCEIIDNKWIL